MPEEQVIGAQAPVVAPAPSPAEAPATPEGQNTADPAAAAPPEGDKPETPEQAEKRGQRRFERRIDRLTRRAAEAEARAQLYEKQLAEAKVTSAPPADQGTPKLEQFDDVEKYAAAKAKFESEKAIREHSAKQSAEAQKARAGEIVTQWETKASRAEGKYEDFDDVVGELTPTTPFAMAIMEAENAEDVAYYLGKNIKEAERISKLHPLSQIREIGKLEAKLLADPPTKPKTPSKAPEPIKPLTGAAPAVTEVPSERDDMKSWMAKRQKQVHGRRGRA